MKHGKLIILYEKVYACVFWGGWGVRGHGEAGEALCAWCGGPGPDYGAQVGPGPWCILRKSVKLTPPLLCLLQVDIYGLVHDVGDLGLTLTYACCRWTGLVHDVADLGLTLTYACCRWTSTAWCTMWWTWARPWCASRSSWSTTWLLDACPSLRGTRAASCRYCITCLATRVCGKCRGVS